MTDELKAVQQREVEFYEDRLTAVRGGDGQIYVSVNEMCAALGIGPQAQRQRIEGHEVLRDGLARVLVNTAGGPQLIYMMRTDLVPLGLSGVRAGAVRDGAREKLIRFQREAARVLWEAFQEGRLTAESDAIDLFEGVSPETIQAVQLAQAVLALARNQALLEARLSGRIAAVETRLETVEEALTPAGRNVTPDQASQVSQAVKAVALALGQKTNRNEFGAVYGELYRKFGITGYKMLPARRFDEAMKFLTDWHETLSGPLPF